MNQNKTKLETTQESLNAASLRHGILLQRLAVLEDYQRDSMKKRLPSDVSDCLMKLSQALTSEIEFIKARRSQLIAELEKL